MGFDLIHGMMTVDHDEDVIKPGDLVRLIAERTGMEATLQGKAGYSAPSWWSRHQRQVLTTGSGLALALGLAVSWLGPPLGLGDAQASRLARLFYVLAVAVAGVELFPRAVRNLVRLRFDIDVLMGIAILGALSLGEWSEAATVAFLYGLSESLEALSLERARKSIQALWS